MPAFYIEGDEPKLADPSGRSLHKINNLLKIIEAKTGSTTITGPVTVSNEVEVTNSTGNPIPVSGTVALDATSLAALENISVTFPATQNVNVTNAGLSVSVSNLPATQPVSLVSVPSHAVTGPLTDTQLRAAVVPISGTVTANTGLTQPLTDTQLRASSVPISNTSTTGATPTTFSSTTYATISASNASRKGLTIFSEGSGLLYVTLGTSTTSASSYTARLAAGDYYEAPFGYTGLVGGLFGSAGTARVTEVT